ncbi:MAG TPA: MFS transporter [Dongiaceae bacterium]|nr:MFS transporter [Dongiaceae bacterium]
MTDRPAPGPPGRAPRAATDAARPLFGGPATAAALVLGMFTEAVGYGMVAPTLPFMARQVGAGETALGLLVGVYAAVGLFVAVPFGILAQRLGRRSLVIFGHLFLAVASIGFVLAPSYPWLLVARTVQGLGAAGVWVGSLTIAADLSADATMGRSLAWITGAWSVGFVVGPALGGIGTLQTPFLIYAGLSTCAFFVALFGLPALGRGGPRATFGGILAIYRRPAVLASGLATFGLAFFYGTVEAFLPLILMGPAATGGAAEAVTGAAAAAGAMSRTRVGLLFTIAGLPSVILPAIAGRIADRYGDLRLIVAGFAFSAAWSLSFLPLYGRAPDAALFFLLGCVEVMVYTPAIALLNRGMPSSDRVFASGSHSYAFSLGFFLGPLSAGLLHPIGGYPIIFGLLAAIGAAAAIAVPRVAARLSGVAPLASGAREY